MRNNESEKPVVCVSGWSAILELLIQLIIARAGSARFASTYILEKSRALILYMERFFGIRLVVVVTIFFLQYMYAELTSINHISCASKAFLKSFLNAQRFRFWLEHRSCLNHIDVFAFYVLCTGYLGCLELSQCGLCAHDKRLRH